LLHSHESAQARRVVTGLDASGLSEVVADAFVTSRLVSAGNTKCDIWRVHELPAALDGWDGLDVGVVTAPDESGLVYRVVTVPPDSEWDMSVGYGDARGALSGMVDPSEAGGILGLHFTETVDIVTVLTGELHVMLESAETLLKPGDTLVQRGTKHAWNNRTDQPALIVALMVSATR
jgi:quercetin dioxygenase-like cupin family protein